MYIPASGKEHEYIGNVKIWCGEGEVIVLACQCMVQLSVV